MGHTPGPWRVNAHDICAGSDAVAGVYGTTGYAPEEAQANARLIAAAPDLLAALKDVEEAWAGNGDMSMAVDAALLAIAKAEEV